MTSALGFRILLLGVLLTSLVVVPTTTADAADVPSYCSDYVQESRVREARVTGTGERVTVLGDSYALGVGLADPTQDWTSLVPGQIRVFAFGGSGYGADSSPCGVEYSFGRRALAAMRSKPDLVVLAGGLNDIDQTDDAIRAGFADVLAVVGDVPALVVGPAAPPSRAAKARRVDEVLHRAADEAGLLYVSMVDQKFAYVGARRIHLSLESQRDYAAVVAEAIAEDPATAAPTGSPSGAPAGSPSDGSAAASDDSGLDAPLVILLGVLAAAVVIAGVAFSLRRR